MSKPRDIEVLEALFVGDEVDGTSIARAAEAAREDDELRGLFNRLALADREVGGDFEAKAGGAWFLESLDDMLADEEQANSVKVVQFPRRRLDTMQALAAAAVALLTLGGVAFYGALEAERYFSAAWDAQQKRQMAGSRDFQPRSAALSPTTYEMPSVEAFCVQRDGDSVKFVGAAQSEFATVRCGLDSEFKLAVRNPDSRLGYGAFIGISDDDSVYWYGPSPAEQDAITVPTTQELSPIGETIRLGVNHEAGSVRLIALFTEEPMKWGPLTGWMNEHNGKLRDGDLEVPGGVVVRQTFEVTP